MADKRYYGLVAGKKPEKSYLLQKLDQALHSFL